MVELMDDDNLALWCGDIAREAGGMFVNISQQVACCCLLLSAAA